MKGIILAGGKGTRLFPLTINQSKHLLPVYNKPMIFYPLSTLILAGVKNLAVITSPEHRSKYEESLSICNELGIEYKVLIQNKPVGVGNGISVAEEFIANDPFWYMLGDNLFHGPEFGHKLKSIEETEFFDKALCFAYRVNNPHEYGVAKFKNSDLIEDLIEKPTNNISNWAIPGIYYLPAKSVAFSKEILPSIRNEIEILDVLKQFLIRDELHVKKVSRGNSWFDLGTFESLLIAQNFVHSIETRQGMHIGNPIEAALEMNMIDENHARNLSIRYFGKKL